MLSEWMQKFYEHDQKKKHENVYGALEKDKGAGCAFISQIVFIILFDRTRQSIFPTINNRSSSLWRFCAVANIHKTLTRTFITVPRTTNEPSFVISVNNKTSRTMDVSSSRILMTKTFLEALNLIFFVFFLPTRNLFFLLFWFSS